MQLEWLATIDDAESIYPIEMGASDGSTPFEIDTRPLIQAVAQDVRRQTDPAVIASRFHSWVIEMVVKTCVKLREQSGICEVVLSGGVFMNALLCEQIQTKLRIQEFCAFPHRLVPANDGGLSLGQVAVAVARSMSA
jgi:hydrogenase maturation protein HypF